MINPVPLTIVKIGGKVIENTESLHSALDRFAQIKGAKILIHGGGNIATNFSTKLGLTPILKNGRRITDENALDVVTMVYAGLVNKKIVSRLQSRNTNAIGLSGADGNVIQCIKRSVNEYDYGLVGDIQDVNVEFLNKLIKSNMVPVLCAITHDGLGQLLNTNADTIASELSTALSTHYVVNLKYCFEKSGVLADPDDDGSSLEYLTLAEYEILKYNKRILGGMVPKLDNAFNAKASGVHRVQICNVNGIINDVGTEIC